MGKPQYDMEQLIENIKRRCSVPTSQLTYEDSDWADLANDELQGEVVPLMMSTREEYFVDFIDVSTPASGVLDFPTDTVSSKVRSICYKANTSPLTLINLPRIDLDVVAGVGFNNYNTLAGFYIQGNDIVLYPANSVPTGTTIRIYYYKRSLVLSAPEGYGRVVAVDTMSNTIQMDTYPQEWVTGTVLNCQAQGTPFAISNPAITVVSTSFPSLIVDNVDDVAVGDYILEQYYAAIPQIPIEAHAYLAQLTAAKALEGLGDTQGMQNALKKAETLKDGLLIMLSQRVDGSVKKLVNPNGGLRLGAGLGRWGRGRSGGQY